MINPKLLDPKIIQRHGWSIYSQNGEDGVLAYLTSLFDCPRTCVEIGGNLGPDGNPECNTANLIANGWTGLIYDCSEIRHPWFKQRIVTIDNINATVPKHVGLLSIDVDGNDYYFWKACETKPSIVVVEYNSMIEGRRVMPYDPEFRWDGSDYFGASYSAMYDLGVKKGYTLVFITAALNMFFLRDDLVGKGKSFGGIAYGPVTRHPTDRSGRKYLEV